MRELPSGDVQLVLAAHALLGEGPIWDPLDQALYWVDILRGLVHRHRPGVQLDETLDVGQPVGAVALRASGGLLLALRDGFAYAGFDGRPLEHVAQVEADRPDHRMNDGCCDSAGRFWAGTMAFNAEPGAGSLYRLDPDLTVTKQLSGVTISNGIDWSLDERTMYYIDSPTQGVDAFDYDPASGEISRRRRLLTIGPELGLPDGLTVDAHGFIWVALYGGGAVHRYSPEGELDLVVRMPARFVTACTFGGPKLTDLYVTSATFEMPVDDRQSHPSAGGLFSCRPGVSGRAAHTFAGSRL